MIQGTSLRKWFRLGSIPEAFDGDLLIAAGFCTEAKDSCGHGGEWSRQSLRTWGGEYRRGVTLSSAPRERFRGSLRSERSRRRRCLPRLPPASVGQSFEHTTDALSLVPDRDERPFHVRRAAITRDGHPESRTVSHRRRPCGPVPCPGASPTTCRGQLCADLIDAPGIFDHDGVLVDSLAYHQHAWLELGRQTGLAITPEFIHETFGMTNPSIFRRLLGEGHDEAESAVFGPEGSLLPRRRAGPDRADGGRPRLLDGLSREGSAGDRVERGPADLDLTVEVCGL